MAQVAHKRRGPPRFLGYTKSQILDFFMRSNARVCATISFSALPIIVFWMYRYLVPSVSCTCHAFSFLNPPFRYQTVLKPAKLEYEAKRQEELLSEGKYHKQ